MKNFFKKVQFLFLVLIGLVSFIFVLFQALPSADQILSAQRSDSATTAAIVKDLGLDNKFKIISTGAKIPGIVTKKVSKEFLDLFFDSTYYSSRNLEVEKLVKLIIN